MKFRESGMPSEDLWASFFQPIETLNRMELSSSTNLWVDIGSGYGTFIIPGSSMIDGKVVGIDIDYDVMELCRTRLEDQGISNVELILNDISTGGITRSLKTCMAKSIMYRYLTYYIVKTLMHF
jgi:tRNA G46 methylase TrmB